MKNWVKYTTAFLAVLVVRLMPFRVPNMEPVMTTLMPLGKVYGKVSAFAFGFLSIFIYDSITSGVGIWTVVTAVSYGLLGLFASYYFKNRSGWKSYATYAIFATLLYDVVTGFTIGPLFFHQSFIISLVGQIPFTMLHLLGNVSFAIVLSPVIEKWVAKEEKKVTVIEKVLFVS